MMAGAGEPATDQDAATTGDAAVPSTDADIHDAATGQPAALCDGTHELKLRVYNAPENARELPGSVVRIENGLPSFAVDGECNYYISGGWSEDANSRNLPWKQGKLDVSMVDQIERSFPLAELSRLQECSPDSIVFDAARKMIESKSGAAECRIGGPRFNAAWSVIADRALELWTSGMPLTGGIWLSAYTSEDDLPAYDWPLSEPLKIFIIPVDVPEGEYKGFSSGVAHLVSDPDAVNKLRAVRERYLMDSKDRPGEYFDTPKVTDGKVSVRLYMRDAIPYEDSKGLLAFKVGA